MAPRNHPGFKYVRTHGGISEYLLSRNGLRVLLKEEHALPVAVCMVTYHVGSRNEVTGNTGATHFLEHLLFKESKHFPRKNGQDVWTRMEGKGARLNATTSLDRTNYFEIVPSSALFEALSFEADRMRHAVLLERDKNMEMTVVRNEFERDENEPADGVEKQIFALAYQAHPYHHPVIGWRSDIEKVSIERLRDFYNTFYWPSNATLTVIGDFETAPTLRKVNATFGKLPKAPHLIPLVYTEEPKQEGPRHSVISRRSTTNMVALAFKVPPALHSDTATLQVLGRVLGVGKESRLQRALIDTGLATEVTVFGHPLRDNGLIIAHAYLTPDTSHEKVLTIIRSEAHKLSVKGVTLKELAAVKAQTKAETAMSRDGVYAVASGLNEAIAVGDWRFFVDYERQVERVTKNKVTQVAKKYLHDDQSTSVFFIGK